jgi:hypothetical protein
MVSADSGKNISPSRFLRSTTPCETLRHRHEAVSIDASRVAEGSMSAVAKIVGLNSRSIRINVNSHDDANFWARYLECTPEELLKAVNAVGRDQSMVRARLALGRVKPAQAAQAAQAAPTPDIRGVA